MSYIDGFVIAVPTANRQKFIEHARQLDPIFIELGAIRVIVALVLRIECVPYSARSRPSSSTQ